MKYQYHGNTQGSKRKELGQGSQLGKSFQLILQYSTFYDVHLLLLFKKGMHPKED